jgi:hypothetical protein
MDFPNSVYSARDSSLKLTLSTKAHPNAIHFCIEYFDFVIKPTFQPTAPVTSL